MDPDKPGKIESTPRVRWLRFGTTMVVLLYKVLRTLCRYARTQFHARTVVQYAQAITCLAPESQPVIFRYRLRVNASFRQQPPTASSLPQRPLLACCQFAAGQSRDLRSHLHPDSGRAHNRNQSVALHKPCGSRVLKFLDLGCSRDGSFVAPPPDLLTVTGRSSNALNKPSPRAPLSVRLLLPSLSPERSRLGRSQRYSQSATLSLSLSLSHSLDRCR